jgi:putative oxidoreductase
MNLAISISRPLAVVEQLLDALQPLLGLAARLWVSWQFFKSGLVSISDWGATLALFQDEYRVPVLPAELAAVVGTFGELFFPVLLAFGLFGRLAALGLSAVNLMAVISYAHVLLAPGAEGAIGQHYLWGFMLLVLAIYGPGRLSLDETLLRRWRGTAG